LTEILQEANLPLAHADTWPEQAALAAAGKWDEFQALADELKGGRRA
jgi:large subunit ribosomal protein L21